MTIPSCIWLVIGIVCAVEIDRAYRKTDDFTPERLVGFWLTVLLWPFMGAFGIIADCRKERRRRGFR